MNRVKVTGTLSLAPAILAFFFSAACSSHFVLDGAPPQHIVFVDTNGFLVDPTGGSGCDTESRRENHYNITKELDQEGKKKFVDLPRTLQWKACLGDFSYFETRTVNDPEAYLDQMFEEMDAFFAGQPAGQPKRVVIVAHGGLNENISNLRTARDVALRIRKDGAYPIFVNWQSSLGSSLVDHVFKVRSGRNRGWSRGGILSAPLYLASGLAEALVRAPASWAYHYEREWERVRRRWKLSQAQADQVYCALRTAYVNCPDKEQTPARSTACPEIAISKGPDVHLDGEGFRTASRNAIFNFFPIRALAMGRSNSWGWVNTKAVAMPFVEGLGQPAWDQMKRHVAVAFRNEDGRLVRRPNEELDAEIIAERDPAGYGAVSVLMRKLQKKIANEKSNDAYEAANGACPVPRRWEITLLGHSMGTLMMNEIIRQFPDISFTNLVYLAAACSLEDYEQSVLPYLADHPETRMFHVTLHDFADLREEYALGAAPSGSLLVWVDEMLGDPIYFRQRTAGRFDNLMMVLPFTPKGLRHQINVRTFGVGEMLYASDPQTHGGFLDLDGGLRKKKNGQTDTVLEPRFWDASFWTPEVKDRETRRQRCPSEPVFVWPKAKR